MKKVAAVIIILSLLLLTGCSDLSWEYPTFHLLNYGNKSVRKYDTIYDLEAVFHENRELFDHVADALSSRADYWNELYEKHYWEEFMVNYPDNSKYFSTEELEEIKQVYDITGPYEIDYQIPNLYDEIPNHEKRRTIRFLYCETHDPHNHFPRGYALYYVRPQEGESLREEFVSDWIGEYEVVKVLEDQKWYLIRERDY